MFTKTDLILIYTTYHDGPIDENQFIDFLHGYKSSYPDNMFVKDINVKLNKEDGFISDEISKSIDKLIKNQYIVKQDEYIEKSKTIEDISEEFIDSLSDVGLRGINDLVDISKMYETVIDNEKERGIF